MDASRTCNNIILTCERCSVNHSFVEYFISYIFRWVLTLTYNIRERDAIDSRDYRQLIDKILLPLRPFSFIFEELPGIGRFGASSDEFNVRFSNLSQAQRFIR
jgi:hypothetical protein